MFKLCALLKLKAMAIKRLINFPVEGLEKQRCELIISVSLVAMLYFEWPHEKMHRTISAYDDVADYSVGDTYFGVVSADLGDDFAELHVLPTNLFLFHPQAQVNQIHKTMLPSSKLFTANYEGVTIVAADQVGLAWVDEAWLWLLGGFAVGMSCLHNPHAI